MKNNMNKAKKSQGMMGLYFKSLGEYISKNYLFLILFFVGLLTVSAVNFVKISHSFTLVSLPVAAPPPPAPRRERRAGGLGRRDAKGLWGREAGCWSRSAQP